MHRAAVGVALALTLLVFGPAMWQGTTVFFGREYVDAWGTQWFYWFVGHQLLAGEGLGRTDLLFYPWGKDVYLHTGGNVLDAVIAAPLRWVLGAVAGYNAFVLCIVATNALAMRALARVWVPGLAADVAAVLFAFNPYVLHELRDGRPTQALLVFLLLFWRSYLTVDGWRGALLAGLTLALTALTYWFYALFAGLAAIGVALVRLRSGTFGLHVLAGAVALLLVAPFAWPMLAAQDVPGLLDVSTWTWTSWSPVTEEGVSIGVYVLDPGSLSSGFYALKDDEALQFIAEDRNLLVVQIVLGLAGMVAAPRRLRAVLGAMLAVSLVVAVGPGIGDVPNLAYLGLVKSFRVFHRLWLPSRALVVAEVAFALCAAFALARLRGRAGVVATLAVVLAWAVELKLSALVPMEIWPGGVPAGYRCLAGADEGAVIELPYAHTQAHLWYQTVHGRPIFGGMVEDNIVFSPPEQVEVQKGNSFVTTLIDQAAEGRQALDYTEEDRATIGALGYRYVVVDKRAYADPVEGSTRLGSSREGRLRHVRRTFTGMLGAPVYEDEQTAIYAPWGHPSPCE